MAVNTKPQTSPRPGNEYLSANQLANRYGVDKATPYRWARNGTFPKPIKLGANCTRWALNDLLTWEEGQRGAF